MTENTERVYFRLALKIIGTVSLIIAFTLLVYHVRWVLGLLLISVLLVYMIIPIVNLLCRYGMPRLAAVITVYFGLIAIIFFSIYLTVPVLINEIVYLTRDIPKLVDTARPYVLRAADLLQTEYRKDLLTLLESAPKTIQDVLLSTLDTIKQTTGLLMSFIANLAIILLTVFYLLRDIDGVKRAIIKAVPEAYTQETGRILGVLDTKVGDYLRGNVVRCGIVGILTGIGLFFLEMKFYLLLGLFAGVMNFILYVGPIIAVIPAILLAFTSSIEQVVLVALLYLTVQAIDGFLLTPVLLGKAVDLQPITIIIAMLFGAKLMGILGVILAIPVAASLKVLLYYYSGKYKDWRLT